LDTVSLTERVLGCYTDLTRLLLNNSDNFSTENMVRNNLLRATGVALDNAALNGSGSSGEPTGLVNVSGVNTTTFSSSGAPTYAEYVAQEAAIWADNKSLDGNATAYLLTPALAGAAKALNTTGAGSPAAMRDGFLNGFPVLISSQVPANNSIIGDFSEFIVATWDGGIEVEASREALFLSGGLRLRILTSMDFAVKHPVSFCVSS
jgi:HK97 family phage major capsid protein